MNTPNTFNQPSEGDPAQNPATHEALQPEQTQAARIGQAIVKAFETGPEVAHDTTELQPDTDGVTKLEDGNYALTLNGRSTTVDADGKVI